MKYCHTRNETVKAIGIKYWGREDLYLSVDVKYRQEL